MALNSVVVNIDPPTSFSSVDANDPKNRQKVASVKQVTWVLLLRLQILFSWMSRAAPGLFHSLKKRVTLSDVGEEDSRYRRRLYVYIRLFLAISVVALIIELMAYFQEWDLKIIYNLEVHGLVELCYRAWLSFRVDYVAPVIINFSHLCIVLFLIQSVDRFVLGLGCLWIKCKKLKPEITVNEYDNEDSSSFPMVLVQIPMCNEKEVFATSISAACQLDWPKERFLIQVLDDSDDELVRELISDEVSSWRAKGVNIVYRHRVTRTGYKAGNLKSAMACDYVKDYEFVAIFDADFQPSSDYLKLTIPHFNGNPDIALVQARWAFLNKEENLLTRLQNINLCFHFEVEQQVNGVFLNFFGFNGTAGVWRIKALEESGGWLERTTVEDMDIAVRAHLKGWKFIYLNDVRVLCEVPECFEAYKKQQYRWHSGPMHLFRLCFRDILSSQISKWKKANLIFLFFLLRKLILPFYSFTLFCIILPLTMFVPEAELPVWVISYVPITMSIINILPDPKSFPFMIPYLLFENTMSVTKFNAMISGLFQLGSSYEWIVTRKTGRSSKLDLLSLDVVETKIPNNKTLQRGSSDSRLDMLDKLKKQAPKSKNKQNKVYRKELALAFLLLTAAARSLLYAHGIHFYYLLFQGLGFLVVGLDLIGEQVN